MIAKGNNAKNSSVFDTKVKIFEGLTRPLLYPFQEGGRSLQDEGAERAENIRAVESEVTDNFFVIEEHVTIVKADAQIK